MRQERERGYSIVVVQVVAEIPFLHLHGGSCDVFARTSARLCRASLCNLGNVAHRCAALS